MLPNGQPKPAKDAYDELVRIQTTCQYAWIVGAVIIALALLAWLFN